MQLQLVFRSVFLVYMITILLSVDSSAACKRGKKQRRSKGSGTGCKSNRLKKKEQFLVSLDPTLNISALAPPCPNRSMSPWTYETSYDDSRIPSQISEAKCERRGCLTEDGEEDLGLESKPILYEIHVLRRVKAKGKKGRYSLKLETQRISVGCTCVLPVVMHQ